MAQLQNKRGALSMVKLTLPLALDQLFRILVSSVDTIMLSSYSEAAVAGVGLMSQYIFFLQLLFNVICTGSSIVLAQYLGAEKTDEELNHISNASIVMVTVIALFVTAVVFLGTGPLLSCYTLEQDVRDAAVVYFLIFGGAGAVFTAYSMLQAAVLRSYGYTKESLIVTIISNIVNIVGNGLSLYGWFNLPVTGVAGVAAASAVSQVVACVIQQVFISRRKNIQFRFIGLRKTPRRFYRVILSIGIPTAGENISYNLAQIVIMAMVSTLGTYAMSAQVYTQTIVRYVYAMAVAIGMAVQIKVGYYVGAGEKETAYHNVFRYSAVATGCSMTLIVLMNLIKSPVISLFTHQPEIVSLVSTLLLCSLYVEFGRSLNLIYVCALKGAGDVKFPVLYGIFSMWGIMVFLSWLLGLKLHLGLAGFWLGIGSDETTRGIVMFFRWKSRRWQSKGLV